MVETPNVNPKYACVYCSSSSVLSKIYQEDAAKLGDLLFQRDYGLVYGGTNVGLMGIIADTIKSNGGNVIGVIPKIIHDKGITNNNSDELIVTEDLRERKKFMAEKADCFVALPGGFGTLEEVFEVLVLKQLNYHNKPILFLNTGGYYDNLIEFFERLFVDKFAKETYRDYYYFAPTPEAAIAYIENYKPSNQVQKWF
ncbi:MAG: LOG family protein [Candidatus Kariarchaeaceae archaeon]|jgi:uncharacterized protein (TIGR00730 family)